MSTTNIESNEEVLLRSLLRFFKGNDQHLRDLASISSQKTIISLREMDFLVTKYSKKNRVSYKLPDGTLFDLNLDYKAQLRGHSKKKFDPFCRIGDKNDSTRLGRIFIDFETKTPQFLGSKTKQELDDYKKREDGVVTNVGQMNFFRWAINNKVVDYCFNNKDKIVMDMDAEYKNKKSTNSKQSNKSTTPKPIIKNINSDKDSKTIIIQFP